MKKIIIYFCLSFLCAYAMGQKVETGIQFSENIPFEEAVKKAQSEKKNIFVDCYADWCGPCKLLAKNTFPLKEVGDFFNSQFINVKYNVEKGEGVDFYKKYRKSAPGLPAMLLMDSKGKVIHSIIGFRNGKGLITEIKNALLGKTLPNLEKKYEKGNRDKDFIVEYVLALKGAYNKKKAKEVVTGYMKDLPVESLLDKDLWKISKEYIRNPYSPDYQFVISNFTKCEFALKENMSALERQMTRGMTRAVDKIIPRAEAKNVPTKTLDSINVLKSILTKNVLKISPDLLLKFKIADYKREERYLDIYNSIAFAQGINLFSFNRLYIKETYEYVIDKIESKQMLKECLKDVSHIQELENSTTLPVNFFNLIGKINERLGDKDKAQKAYEKYNKLEEINNEKVKGFFNIFKKDEKK